MTIFYLCILISVLISNGLSDTPVYSENYAKIRYQHRENWRSHKAELNLDERHREEVTEKLPSNEAKSPQGNAALGNPDVYDVTTEPESEQINLARFVYKNIVKDKLVEENKNDTKEMFIEVKSTNIPAEESTIKEDDNVMKHKENIGSIKENFDTLEDDEFLEDLDQSEITNLNHQGVYYIYHPNMLLQKVVYRTEEDSDNMKVLTQIKYDNVAPIMESIYSYDPRTFVLQRLILRPQEQT